jgi:hypothetical protein
MITGIAPSEAVNTGLASSGWSLVRTASVSVNGALRRAGTYGARTEGETSPRSAWADSAAGNSASAALAKRITSDKRRKEECNRFMQGLYRMPQHPLPAGDQVVGGDHEEIIERGRSLLVRQFKGEAILETVWCFTSNTRPRRLHKLSEVYTSLQPVMGRPSLTFNPERFKPPVRMSSPHGQGAWRAHPR